MTTTTANRIAEALISPNRSARTLARVAIHLSSFDHYGRNATSSYITLRSGNVYFVSAVDIISKERRTANVTGRIRATFKARYLRGLLVVFN